MLRCHNVDVTIFASNGTLSTLSQLPANLDAFANYALDHPGGTFVYNNIFNRSIELPFYISDVTGLLGAVPEPSTIVSMTVGMSLPLCFVLVSQRRRRRIGPSGPN